MTESTTNTANALTLIARSAEITSKLWEIKSHIHFCVRELMTFNGDSNFADVMRESREFANKYNVDVINGLCDEIDALVRSMA